MEHRFRQTSMVVGPHILPLTHVEVRILMHALDEHRRELKARLVGEVLSDDRRRALAIEANVIGKIIDLAATGDMPRDPPEIARWRTELAASIKRKLGLARRRSSTRRETARETDTREPWEQFADAKRAENSAASVEGSR
jgi:hypothetical protein